MKSWLGYLLLSTLPLFAGQDVLLIQGAAGNEAFKLKFEAQTEQWKAACEHPNLSLRELRSRESITTYLKEHATDTGSLWIIFIGHGTFDGKAAKFNLEGRDLSDREWADLLKPVERELILINTSSGSAPFLKALAAKNRIVLTATRSGYESSYAYLGEHLARAFNGLEADFDKDQRISLLEAFIYASRRVADFYEEEGRIQTEHALLDDNGDAKGTQGDWFIGVRPDLSKLKKARPDGYRAIQVYLAPEPDHGLSGDDLDARDGLERKLFDLRDRKSEMDEDRFYQKLERLLTELNAYYPASP